MSPSFKKSPKVGGYRGLIETISAISLSILWLLVADDAAIAEEGGKLVDG